MGAGMMLAIATVAVPLCVRAVMILQNRLPYPGGRGEKEPKPLAMQAEPKPLAMQARGE